MFYNILTRESLCVCVCVCVCVYTDFLIFQIFSRMTHLVFSIFMIINQAFKVHGKGQPVPHPDMGRKSVLHHKNGR